MRCWLRLLPSAARDRVHMGVDLGAAHVRHLNAVFFYLIESNLYYLKLLITERVFKKLNYIYFSFLLRFCLLIAQIVFSSDDPTNLNCKIIYIFQENSGSD